MLDWPKSLTPGLRNTRALERFKNQIFFAWWFHRHFISVIAIFEDYHYLWGIHKSGFVQRKCFVRRSEDLEKLQGWSLNFSYILEALDALEPIFKTFIEKLGDLISLLLVKFIGQSLGLILKGIQNSINLPRWNSPNNKPTPSS